MHHPASLSDVGRSASADLLCLSHLRWDFVFQRPQHLMSRFAKHRRVFYWEEPVYDAASPHLETRSCPQSGIEIVTPHLPSSEDEAMALRGLLATFALIRQIERPVVWFYTPQALVFLPESLNPSRIVYDCMDELSLFQGASSQLPRLEQELLRRSDVVFTGGHSLYEAKMHMHSNVHACPSGVDTSHFNTARKVQEKPADQASIPHPRLGFCGVIDERMDVSLVGQIAELRPDWHIIMIGPVVKIDPASLPKSANIHWLGKKEYAQLPQYFAGWDVAIMPFALNDSTRFISPTKTPEYLSAGLPVVSTAIRDVVNPYGVKGLVHIAGTAQGFVAAAEEAMRTRGDEGLRQRADEFLTAQSWDAVWERMNRMIAPNTGTYQELDLENRRETSVANV
jgi:UDP-galactopyranose mutase